ncbi:MAG TPA: hypothetical protein DCL73_13190, partial [Treponema sp.]|nr:hypothetical protein [Treponema sp.]
MLIYIFPAKLISRRMDFLKWFKYLRKKKKVWYYTIMQGKTMVPDAKQLKSRVHSVTYIILTAIFIALFFFLCGLSLKIIKESTADHYESDCIHLAEAYSYAFSELIDKYLSDLKSFSSSDVFKYETDEKIASWI